MSTKKQIYIALMTALFSTTSSPSFAKDNIQPVQDISQIEVDEDKLRHAVASRTLTWLTGSSSNNDYVSVGRLANFFGFVTLRVSSNHSLSRSAVAKDTLHVLEKKQQSILISLVNEQKEAFKDVQSTRFEMNRALEGLLVGEAISREEFLEMGAAYGQAEAELGRVIGQSLGSVASSLSPKQKTSLSQIRDQYISGQHSQGKIKGIKTKLSKVDKKELINLAARLLSWTTGNEAFNDFEVVGKPSQHFGFVSLRIESNHGVKRGEIAKEVMALLSPAQQNYINEAARQNITVFGSFMESRKQLMRSLEVAMSGEVIDRGAVMRLGQEMGRAEAEMTWAQAMAMLDIRESMSDGQRKSLLGMRAKYTGNGGALPENLFDRGRQLYSQCALCHTPSGPSVGPNLAGVLERKIADDATFSNYSSAFKNYANSNNIWNEALLDAFLKSPRTAVPGTYMSYDGIENKKDREAIITYIRDRD